VLGRGRVSSREKLARLRKQQVLRSADALSQNETELNSIRVQLSFHYALTRNLTCFLNSRYQLQATGYVQR
jgi:hypothetical protein